MCGSTTATQVGADATALLYPIPCNAQEVLDNVAIGTSLQGSYRMKDAAHLTKCTLDYVSLVVYSTVYVLLVSL